MLHAHDCEGALHRDFTTADIPAARYMGTTIDCGSDEPCRAMVIKGSEGFLAGYVDTQVGDFVHWQAGSDLPAAVEFAEAATRHNCG